MVKIFDFEHMPIVDIVNDILVDATKKGASDIHFDPKAEFMQIRIRIDGILTNYATIPNEYVKNLITRIKIISGMNITESRLPQDGAIKGLIKNIEVDLRVSSINTSKGEKIVIRILDYSLSLNGIEKLGFSDYNYKKVLEMINEPNGIILVTGATGTGKTTTVYSILQRLNNEGTNIMSIEDPIEMDMEGVNQIQVNPEIGLTFASALRSILRQDPNIIMIGEIRDSETATIAIRASVTGHLVLSTLHTNDSLSTIERLMDMDVEKYLLAEALTGIISQKLARKLCPHCKRKRKTTQYEKDIIKKTLNIDISEIYEAVGCEKCNNGYKGRTAIQEVLLIDQTIKDALSMNIRKDKLRKLVYNNNVITLLQDGMIKVVKGKTTIEELLKLIELDKEENNSSFNLIEAIIDSELTKDNNQYIEETLSENEEQDEEQDEEQNEDTNLDNDEFIIPETDDVVIDSIDEIVDTDTDNDSDLTNNMENLDNIETFIDDIELNNSKSQDDDFIQDNDSEKDNYIEIDSFSPNESTIENNTHNENKTIDSEKIEKLEEMQKELKEKAHDMIYANKRIRKKVK